MNSPQQLCVGECERYLLRANHTHRPTAISSIIIMGITSPILTVEEKGTVGLCRQRGATERGKRKRRRTILQYRNCWCGTGYGSGSVDRSCTWIAYDKPAITVIGVTNTSVRNWAKHSRVFVKSYLTLFGAHNWIIWMSDTGSIYLNSTYAFWLKTNELGPVDYQIKYTQLYSNDSRMVRGRVVPSFTTASLLDTVTRCWLEASDGAIGDRTVGGGLDGALMTTETGVHWAVIWFALIQQRSKQENKQDTHDRCTVSQ